MLLGADDATFLGQHGHHRRRLALLAVLAADGDRGRSRDQLLLLFWPEATQSRARHSLDQLLYALRNSLGESVFDGVNPVRLNPHVVSSDVGAFNAALTNGDLDAAVALYRGPFLDGFYVDDAPEFERWVESERARLATSYANALERLARDAGAANDHATAVRWWRLLVETDPVSGKNATGLIGALVNAGDHAAALQYAKRYEARVAEELGMDAGPAVAALMDEVRAKARTEPSTVLSQAALDQPVSQPARVDIPTQLRSVRRRSPPYLIGVLATVIVVASVVWLRPKARDGVAVRRNATPSIAAYELYRRGTDPAVTRTDSGARAGIEYFRQAIALDPRYAAAYAGLARLYTRIGVGDDREMPLRDRMALAEQAALKAVALDDSLGEAHLALGIVKRYNLDLAGAETEMKRAVALEPANSRFHEVFVQLYVFAERDSEALVEAHRAVELDPLSPSANVELAHALLANDRCDEALAQLQKLTSLRPPLLRANSYTAQCYTRRQMWPEAVAELQQTLTHAGPRGEAQMGYVLARAGRRADAQRILTTLLDRSRRIDGGAFEVAIVYVGLGDRDQAFAWLDKAVEDRSLGLEWLPTIVDDLHPDPRFDRLRRRIGIQER